MCLSNRIIGGSRRYLLEDRRRAVRACERLVGGAAAAAHRPCRVRSGCSRSRLSGEEEIAIERIA